jgi:hypothetical protein
MKQFTKIATAIAAFALSGMAHAGWVPTTYTNQGGSGLIDATHPYTVNFDLTKSPTNYRTSIDSIAAANLSFNFSDTGPDNANNTNNESFTIAIGSDLLASSGGVINVPNNGSSYGPFSISGVSLSNLNTTGTLSLLISANSGSFNFVSSTLNADVHVPEPLSVALLGIGLAGIGASRRKARKA